MAWYLNPALSRFRREVDAAYPNRDRASDGTLGDEYHQATNSDHNPDRDGSVDAWDMDVELNGPGEPYQPDVEWLKFVFECHESSWYWIHNSEIASRGNGWIREPYAGPNTHKGHVHWNTRESHENSAEPWRVAMLTAREIIGADVAPGDEALSLGNTVWQARAAARSADAKLDQLLARPPVVGTIDLDALKTAIREAVREEIDRTKLGVE